MLRLRYETPPGWFEAVRQDLTAFLQDHAHNERKVAQSALVLATHYPTHVELVDAALEIADEELQHFRLLWRILQERGAHLGYDMPDPYMKAMFAPMRRRHMDEYLLDRLIVYAVVEARGCERFALVARGLGEDDPLGRTYLELERSEARHHGHYLRLARLYFPADVVGARLDALLDHEADAVSRLPFRAALHYSISDTLSSNLFAGRRVLAVFPHPDDESWAAGGLLQRAPEVHLVTLSRGEAGRDHRDGLTGPALAARRGGELHAACATLGLAPARLLDLPDGAIDRDVAAAAITPIVNELSPELVITFDRDGGYGHVDHVATCEATLEAVRRAAPTACVLACAFAPDLLAPLRAAFAQRHPELLHPAFATTPLGSERADLVLTLTRDEARAKRRALTAHASQMRHPGDAGPDRFLGPGVFQRLCRAERYVLLAGRPWW